MADKIDYDELERADAAISWAEMPTLRKVGRYLFFAACAFGLGGLVYIIMRKIGFNGDIAGAANSVASFVAFFALRDMSKQWDWALNKRAKAIADRPSPLGDRPHG